MNIGEETKLYQLDSAGKTKIWTISYYNNSGTVEIMTTSQLEGGKISEDFSQVKELKQGYKSLEEQAMYNVQSKINLKKRAGWTENRDEAKPDYILGSGSYRPMLANSIDPEEKVSNSKSIENWGIANKIVAIQPKLDGNRLLVHVYVENASYKVDMFSREGEPMNFPHIREAILGSCNNITRNWDIWLDGEIYNHSEEFDFINGTYRQFNDVDKGKQERLQYHIYDCWVLDSAKKRVDLHFKERDEMLKLFLSSIKNRTGNLPSCLHKVSTYFVECTQEILDNYLEQFVSEGYEGLMVRQLNMPYEFKRTKQLLKYKPKRVEDAEFECVGVKESVYGDMVGSMYFKLPNGETFKGTPNVPQERCKEWWKNKELIIGKMFTVVFNGYTQYGKPRFPRVKCERS